jgi:hypothetical protein
LKKSSIECSFFVNSIILKEISKRKRIIDLFIELRFDQKE